MKNAKRLPIINELNEMYQLDHGFDICQHKVDIDAYLFDEDFLSKKYEGYVFILGRNTISHENLKLCLEETVEPGCMNKNSKFYLESCGKEQKEACSEYLKTEYKTQLPMMRIPIYEIIAENINGAFLGEPDFVYDKHSFNVLGDGGLRHQVLKDALIEYYVWMDEERSKED